jgi:hypothetical protein
MIGNKVKNCLVAVMLFSFFYFSSENVHGAATIELLQWEKVNEILPKYSKFTVTDIETGKKFRVQRRAGSRHADVQPLTNKDTKIMKEIYDGKWSWKRRAILIIKGNQKIPASMHGMPHGAGALKNNFPGHFCIHFYGSTTHRTNSMDLSHKLMILKAAKSLENYLAGPDPYEVINAFIAGVKEQDEDIVRLVSLQALEWKDILYKIEAVRISQITVLPVEDLMDEVHLTIPIKIDLYINGMGMKKFNGNIELIRFSQLDPWKIDSETFMRQNGINLKEIKKS